jgi:hypothetical protein
MRADAFSTPMPVGVPPELEQQIDAIAPRPPMSVISEEDVARWEICARTAAAIAVHQRQADPELDDAELRHWAWHATRTFFDSPVPA